MQAATRHLTTPHQVEVVTEQLKREQSARTALQKVADATSTHKSKNTDIETEFVSFEF